MTASPAPGGAGFHLPPTATRTLSNGARLFVMEYHKIPLIELEVIFPAGAALDPAGREGIADLTADLLRKGAGARGAKEIADVVDFAGGALSASADQDGTRIAAEFLARDLDLALELVSDIVMRPSFTPEEVERLKGETIGELQAMRENPGLMASRRFIEILYAGHPYGHPTAGWEKSVAAITREEIMAFYRAHYRPAHAIIIAVGDFNGGEVMSRLERRFGEWKGDAGTAPHPPRPASPKGRTVTLIEKADATQSQIRIGGVGIRRTDPDYAALQVANTILGGGFTSRLVEEIRVNRGLSYGVGSRFYPLVEAGPFLISASTKNESTLEAIQVTLAELDKFRKEGPTIGEVAKARRYMRGTFAIGHQTPDAMADALGEIAFYNLPANYYDTWLDRIDAVRVEDVRKAAAAHLPAEDLTILVLGQAAAISKDLQTLGPLQTLPLARD